MTTLVLSDYHRDLSVKDRCEVTAESTSRLTALAASLAALAAINRPRPYPAESTPKEKATNK